MLRMDTVMVASDWMASVRVVESEHDNSRIASGVAGRIDTNLPDARLSLGSLAGPRLPHWEIG